MRLLAACSLGGAGHLNPLVPFLSVAERQGDDVVVVAPPALQAMVEARGFRFWPGGAPPEELVAPIRERLPLAPLEEARVLANRELFGRLATEAMLPHMDRACAEWEPDLVLREPCEYSSAVVAGQRGIRVAQVAISLAEAEAGSIDAAGPALEDHRHGLTDELWTAPYVSPFPASLDPSPFPNTVRFRPPVPDGHAPLPDWWGGASGPLVYATLGTVLGYMSIGPGVYRTVLHALAGLEVRVLMTVGHTIDPAVLGPVPDNVHVEQWVEQERILGQAALVVCHGGSGTVLGALSAGVPLVVVPLFADQFENGRRVVRSGAGRVVAEETVAHARSQPLDDTDALLIRRHIEMTMGHPAHREAARRISGEMASRPGVEEILAGLTT